MVSQQIVNFYGLLFFIICCNKCTEVLTLQCKGEDNQDVDWFFLYKIPKIKQNKIETIQQGVAYLYMDNKNYQNGWTLSKNNITSKQSILGYTLAPLYYNDSKNLLWILYNDQPPNEPANLHGGHTKGVFISNDNEGLWLIHSVPNFPPRVNNESKHSKLETQENKNKTEKLKILNLPIGAYSYPSSGKVNGQSFLCISLNKTDFNNIGKQLKYNEINVYNKNIPNYFLEEYSDLVDASNEVYIKNEPFNNKINVYSKSEHKFTSFAKTSKWGKDLYDDFVAPQLDTDLYTETWLNGRGRLPSDCNGSRIMNIESISLPLAEINFHNTHDHSKWAVSIKSNNKNFWVCVGDINRAHTQFERGGGTVCFNNTQVWESYKNSVYEVEPCPTTNFKNIFNRIRSWFQ